MRAKSKCGSTFCSASSTILRVLPVCRSLSALMMASTSSVTRFTSASGASWAAAARGKRAAARMARSLRSMAMVFLCREAMRPQRAGAGFRGLFFRRRLFLRLAEQELADQLLQHHRRLGDLDAVALGELLVLAARLEPDVGLAEQPRSEDRCGGVLRELVALVERKRDRRLEALVVELDV